MTKLFLESISILLDQWHEKIESEGGMVDVDIEGYMISFSGDVISRACFGSSNEKGKEIFHKLN